MRYLLTLLLVYSLTAGNITAQKLSPESNIAYKSRADIPVEYLIIHPNYLSAGTPALLPPIDGAYRATTNLAVLPEMEMDKEDVSGYASLIEFMQSRLAGVSITKNPSNPSGYAILIRGQKSLMASNTPLFVLNGIVVPGLNLNNIDPNHVKSVDVLKGPDATMYGSRGANGVIVIKTK